MKQILTIIAILSCFCATAQTSPQNAVRFTNDNFKAIPLSNSPLLPGLSTQCLTLTNYHGWAYIAICDTTNLQADAGIQSDSAGFIMYGPFQDTINLNSKLIQANGTCYPNGTNWNFTYLAFNPGIYYFLFTDKNPNLEFSLNYMGLPYYHPFMYCDNCNGPKDQSQTICNITLDANSMRNKITWEKSGAVNVAGFCLYRENSVFNYFDSIAYIPYSAMSEYIDMTANPAARIWRYKLFKVDSCGNKPDSINLGVYLKKYHAIFLQQSVSGINTIALNWANQYYPQPGDGAWTGTFYIYRGNSTGNMQLLDSVPTTIYNYTDVNPLPGPNYYQVALRKNSVCTPSMLTGYTESRSNFSGVLFTGIKDIQRETTFSIFPNPASDQFSITLHDAAKHLDNSITVLDCEGRLIRSFGKDELLNTINVSDLQPGIYMLQLTNSKGTSTKRLVLQ